MIGFYDSGLGGIGVYVECKAILPEYSMVYYGDTVNCPLGDKTPDEIFLSTQKGVKALFEKGCNIVILACNTSTAIAVRRLQEEFKYLYPYKRILGIIRPVSEGLLEMDISKETNLALLATQATVNSQFYDEELKAAGYENVIDIVAPGLADCIESNPSDAELKSTLDRILIPFTDFIPDLDIVILACTHYPLVSQQIRNELLSLGAKPDIMLFIQAPSIAQKLSTYIQRHPSIYLETSLTDEFFVTSNPLEFQEKLQTIFGITTKVQLTK
jgi:glutamate racemase